MNHLLKIIRFYKLLKDDDLNAVNQIILIKDTQRKQIEINDLLFIYHLPNKTDECIYCLDWLYKEKLPLITIEINEVYYYIKQRVNPILNSHFEIINLSHTKGLFDIYNLKIINDFFPSFMILYNPVFHTHYDLGLIESPIIKKDGNSFYNNVYLVDWYLQTFLIKEREFELIKEEYIGFRKKYNYKNMSYLFFKRSNYFYLYFIVHKPDITPFEAIGYFTYFEEKESFLRLYSKAKEKLI